MTDLEVIEHIKNKLNQQSKQTNLIETLQKMLSRASDLLATDDGRQVLWKRLKKEVESNDVTSKAVRTGLTGAAIGGAYGLLHDPKTPEEQYKGVIGRVTDNALQGGALGALGGGAYQVAKNTLLY